MKRERGEVCADIAAGECAESLALCDVGVLIDGDDRLQVTLHYKPDSETAASILPHQ